MTATFAAIIPLHNKAPFIERALHSAIAQTSPADEIIVVDDASTDGGMILVEAFAAQHSTQRFTLLHRQQSGPGGYAARNAAVQAAQADWVAFLDADDEWTPEFVATLRALIDGASRDVGAVFMSRQIVRPDGSEFLQTALRRDLSEPVTMDFDGFLRLWRALGRCPMWTSATAIRRDVLLAAGLFPAARCKRGGDKDTWLRVMTLTKAIGAPAVGAVYYMNVADQVTRTVTLNQRHCLCDTLLPLIEASRGERQRLLKWIFNSEVLNYARWMFGQERIAPEVYRGFYARENPVLYLALRVVSLTPLPLQRTLRDVLKGMTGSRAFAWPADVNEAIVRK